MKIKKFLVVSLLSTGMLLTACGPKSSGGGDGPIEIDTNVPKEALGTYDITMWGSETEGVEDLFKKQVKDFCDLNPGLTINVTYEGVSEKDAKAKVLQDVDAAADIYCFAQDQFADLVQGKALNKLGETAGKAVKANNDAGSVAAVTSGDALYAYPMTADNGYYLYYDTRVVKSNHIGSMEDILADCESAQKNFAMETSTSAWYLASFFFGAGCVSEWTTDAKGNFTNVNDDFNSAKGIIAMRGMQRLVKSTYYVSSSSVQEFAAATPAGAVVSGPWDYNKAVELLGDNLGIVELPSYKVDGTSYHLGSYSGYKLMGVKPSADVKRLRVLSTLALYLTGEKCQDERFDAVAWGPSNKVDAAKAKVQANPAVAALTNQSKYAKPQMAIPGAWWDFAKVLGTAAKEAELDDTTALQAALTSYQQSVNNVVNPTEVAKLGLVGSFAGATGEAWKSATAKAFTQNTDGTWTLTTALAVGDEFKAVMYDSKSVQWGTHEMGFGSLASTSSAYSSFEDNSGNIKCKIAGTYTFTATFATAGDSLSVAAAN